MGVHPTLRGPPRSVERALSVLVAAMAWDALLRGKLLDLPEFVAWLIGDGSAEPRKAATRRFGTSWGRCRRPPDWSVAHWCPEFEALAR